MFTDRKVPRGPRSRLRARKQSGSHRWLSETLLRVESLEDRRLLSAAPLGDEFEVATFEGSQGAPRVVHDAQGNFIVAWANVSRSPEEVGTFAQRYNAAGEPQGDAFRLALDRSASMAMNDSGQFVVAWGGAHESGDRGEIIARRYDASGAPLDDEFVVNSFTTGFQRSPTVAMDAEGDFVVAWSSRRGGPDPEGHEAGIFARRFDADGTPEGDEFRVSDRQRTARLGSSTAVMNDRGEFAIAWGFDDGEDLTFNVQQFNADGTPRGAAIVPFFGRFVDGLTPFEISIGQRGDLIIAAQGGGILAQRFSADGTPQGEIVRAAGNPADFGLSQDSAGNFLLAWPWVNGIRAQRYSAAGVPLEDEIIVSEGFGDESAAFATAFLDDQGQFAVVWERVVDFDEPRQILARQYVGTSPLAVAGVSDAGGVHLLGDNMGRMPIDQLLVQFSGAVSTDGGSSGVHSVTNPANWQLLKNAVDISDQIVGIDYADSVATINLASTLRADNYEIIASDAIQDPDGAALDGNGDEVPGGDFSTTFRAGPLFVQGESVVVASEAGQLESPHELDLEITGLVDVAVAASGQHVAVWGAFDDSRIFAQRYDAAGGPLGEAILVDEQENPVYNPRVAIDGQGNFVVSWTIAQFGFSPTTKIRRYDAEGTPLADAEVISSCCTLPVWSSVAADADGNFVVVESDFFGRILLHRFNAEGVRQSDEILVGETTTAGLGSADVAMNSSGEFVVSWVNSAIAGGPVSARAYSPLGIPRSDAVEVAATSERVNFVGGAIDEQGNFVVAWQGTESMARRFDADGVPLGDAISVSPLVGESYSVTIAPDGGFHVAWANHIEQVVYVQQVSASGERVGSEVRVNPGSLGLREEWIRPVASAVDAAGDIVIAWTGEAILPDRDWGNAPFLQRFVTDHPPLVDLNGGQLGIDFTTDHVAGDGPVPVADPNALFVNSSFLGVVESATVSIDGFLAGDVLAFDTTGTDIVGNFAAGVLSLAGSDSPANYQEVLRSVTFDTTAVRPTSAAVDVSFVVDDGTLTSPLATSEISNFVSGSASLASPQLFYHQPAGGDDDALADRESAIATDKAGYVPGGGPASFANVSSYVLGINGVVLDLTGTHGEISADDFAFRTGNSDALHTWSTAPAPSGVSVIAGGGEGGADRVELVWDQDAIVNQWLEITVAASGRTGLAEPEVFYFGSRVGDSGEGNSPVVAMTTGADMIAVRRRIGSDASATSPYDFDRDGTISATDELIARSNIGFLPLIDIGEPIPSAPASAAGAIASALALQVDNDAASAQPDTLALLESPAAVLDAPSPVATAAVFAGDRDVLDSIDDESLAGQEPDDDESPAGQPLERALSGGLG